MHRTPPITAPTFTANRLERLKAKVTGSGAIHVVVRNGECPLWAKTVADISEGIDIVGGGVFFGLNMFIKFCETFALKELSFFYRKLKK